MISVRANKSNTFKFDMKSSQSLISCNVKILLVYIALPDRELLIYKERIDMDDSTFYNTLILDI